MISAPLLAAFLALAGPASAQQAQAPKEPAGQRTDPETVAPEHREAFDRYAAWRDAEGGLPAGLAAARKKDPAGAEATFKELKSVLTKDEYAVLEAQYRLAARGVDAAVPEGADLSGRRTADPAAPPPAASAAPAPAAGAAPAPPASGLRTNPPPGPPAAKPQRQAAAETNGGWTIDGALDWICRYYPCARS